MILYVYVLLVSWLWGALKLPVDSGWKGVSLEIVKGAAAIIGARFANNTGLTMTVAMIGLLTGHAWSPWLRFKERPAQWVALGALAAFSPLVCGVALLSALLIFYLSGTVAIVQLGIALLLPFLLWQVKKYDIYVVFGFITSIILTYQAIPLLNPDKDALRKRLRLRQFLAVATILFVAVTLFLNRYVYQGFGKQVDILRRGTQEFKVVALTFDDGPDPVYTQGVLDILQRYDVTATFFMVGRHVQQYPDIARRVAVEGHSIGNHTWSHRSLVPLTIDHARSEIMRAHNVIKDITGITPKLLRPPRGVYSAFTRDYLKEQGYTMVLWDVTSQDWAELPARRIAANVLSHAGPGSILLFHDSGNLVSSAGGNRINTLRALPIVIEGLLEEGYTFLTIEELVILTGLTGEEGLD